MVTCLHCAAHMSVVEPPLLRERRDASRGECGRQHRCRANDDATVIDAAGGWTPVRTGGLPLTCRCNPGELRGVCVLTTGFTGWAPCETRRLHLDCHRNARVNSQHRRWLYPVDTVCVPLPGLQWQSRGQQSAVEGVGTNLQALKYSSRFSSTLCGGSSAVWHTPPCK
jgi:hypothetical protein